MVGATRILESISSLIEWCPSGICWVMILWWQTVNGFKTKLERERAKKMGLFLDWCLHAGPRGRDGIPERPSCKYPAGKRSSTHEYDRASDVDIAEDRHKAFAALRRHASTEIKSSGKQTTTELLKFKLLIYMDNGTGAGVRCGVFLWQRFQETRWLECRWWDGYYQRSASRLHYISHITTSQLNSTQQRTTDAGVWHL